jgi:hypothetical protein
VKSASCATVACLAIVAAPAGAIASAERPSDAGRVVKPTPAQALQMRQAHASGPLRLVGTAGETLFFEYSALDRFRCVVAGSASSFVRGGACTNQLPQCGRGFVTVAVNPNGSRRDGVCFRGLRLRVLFTARGPTWTQRGAAELRRILGSI